MKRLPVILITLLFVGFTTHLMAQSTTTPAKRSEISSLKKGQKAKTIRIGPAQPRIQKTKANAPVVQHKTYVRKVGIHRYEEKYRPISSKQTNGMVVKSENSGKKINRKALLLTVQKKGL